jgi:FlaA1/EpsC-like NDP-sugar epimerase
MAALTAELPGFYRGKRVLVIGGAGTVGAGLVQELLALPIEELRILDQNESELYFLSEEHAADPRVHCFLGDIRDEETVHRMCRGMELTFHTAALKHVTMCERSPSTVVQTNVVGVESVIRAALATGVRRVLFTSSDKAVNPTNVMGTSKLMGERLITAANATTTDPDAAIFASTRFGNVAGSRGSVIPLFCRQISTGRRITVTDERMTRFIMSRDRAVQMLLETMVMAVGGEVFVTKMPVMRIVDIARVMIELLAPLYGRNAAHYEIEMVGARPGEKLWEELTTDEEIRRTLEIDDYFVVLPAFRNVYGRIRYEYPGAAPVPASQRYVSSQEPPLGEAEVARFLLEPGVLPEEIRQQLLRCSA